MTKYTMTTTISVHGSDTPIELADSASNNAGSAAWAALIQGKDVKVKTDDGTMLIPYHAVIVATMTVASSTAEDPEDEFCTPVE